MKEYFCLEKYIFIIRNPFDNIRSILNRLELPGDGENINVDSISLNWQYIFKKTKGKDYITVLANRWILANDQQKIINSEKCILVKYEDFKMDKEEFINNLVIKAGFKPNYSVKDLVDIQYQPKGNPNVDLLQFFGKKNYKKIELICGELIKRFDY